MGLSFNNSHLYSSYHLPTHTYGMVNLRVPVGTWTVFLTTTAVGFAFDDHERE